MLADSVIISTTQVGNLGADVHAPATLMYALLEFVASELPRWRDRVDRTEPKSENALTAQLCGHLNSAARLSQGWDILQFRREEPDEIRGGRSIDLVAAPCGVRVWMHGKCFHDYQSLLPIECKRLPTPKGSKRDEREYVVTRYGSTGGIQRFKSGDHGASHNLGAMIAYVQEGSLSGWHRKIDTWINELARSDSLDWSSNDLLQLVRNDRRKRVSVYRSTHLRNTTVSSKIELRHLWIVMSP